ncbi:MAG: DNA cytosine methyltransferase [Synergistaceae bacterium]|nr:DNA cytosine methyltransferase [Synergistaceae bacterium]
MKALSLFSGIGGLDLAAEAAGIKTVAFCEIDPFCREVLAKHWPGVPIFEDVFALRGEDVGTVDVIHGGFPCQPFSLAGRQRGRDDERYLWPEFSRLVGEIKPLWVVAENVPGIYKHDVAGAVCEDLERQGYAVGIWNYEAACVGAPHRRSRVFFVGHAQDVPDRYGLREQQSQGGICEIGRRASDVREDVANAESGRLYHGDDREDVGKTAGEINAPDDSGEALSEPQFGSAGCDSWWLLEPDVGRVAYGVPRRVDRLRALGNAVVPAQSFPIFQAIVEAESMKEEQKCINTLQV